MGVNGRERLGALARVASLGPLRRLVERVDRRMRPFEDVDVAYGGTSVRLRGFRHDHITRQLALGSFYELSLLDFIARTYGTGGVYVDIGAFIGNHTVFFALACQADRVIAVEPAPRSFAVLRHNVDALGLTQVDCHNVATGDHAGHVRLVAPPADNRGMTSVASAGDGIPLLRGDDLIDVPPKLIKIDAEGWGLATLRGLERTIREHHPVIVVEPQPEPVQEVARFLDAFGYQRRGRFNRTHTYVFD